MITSGSAERTERQTLALQQSLEEENGRSLESDDKEGERTHRQSFRKK